jgi:hypothetical protein
VSDYTDSLWRYAHGELTSWLSDPQLGSSQRRFFSLMTGLSPVMGFSLRDDFTNWKFPVALRLFLLV